MGDTQTEILRVIRDVVGPLLRADGGIVYMVQASDEEVRLHLGGRFAGCAGNTLTTRRVIEPAIFAVAPNAKVTVTSGPILPHGAQLLTD
jgi:Fe-S cluster biogenesis protein NfuA